MATTATEEPTISQGGKISTFDKISGAQASLNPSSATNMFQAYSSGQMTSADEQAYEAHVNAGDIMLPRGATLKGAAAGGTAAPTPQGEARVLPAPVWEAYSNNSMSPEDRISLEKHVKSGDVALPADNFVMGKTEMPKTTLGGLGAAALRGVAPVLPMAAAGAGIGAALGTPIGGVGALPGAAAGALVGAGTSLLADPLTEAFNKLTGGHVGMPTEAIQQLLSHFGVQVPDTAVEHVMQSMAGGAVAGVSGAGAAKVIGGALGMAPMALNAASKLNKVAPTLTRFAAEMAEAPVAQAIAGAGAGGSAQIAAEHGAGPGMQLAAGLLGGAATGVAGTMHLTGPNAADLAGRQLAAEGEQFKIPVLTSDVSPPRTFVGKNLQAAGERVPYTGTGPVRAAQQEARLNAVREFVQEHGGASAAEAVEEVTANLLATHGEKLNKYNGKKLEVINRLSTNAAVPTPNAIAEIDKQINFLSSLKLNEFKPAIAILEDWKQASQGQSLSNIEVLRKQIGNVFQAPELASVRDTSEKALSSIYHAINEDMGEFILANGERRDFAKWKIANLRLRDMSEEVDDKAVLKTILNKGEATPELVRKMLFSTKPSDVRVLYSKLSPSGRTSAEAAIVAEAAEKATSNGVIIPDRFSSNVDKLSTQFGVFFPGDAKRKVDGLVSVLRATKRAGEAAAHPPTGVQVATIGSALAAGHITGSAIGGGALLGGSGMLARLYESAPVRNLLLRLPHVRIGSAEDSAIMQRINNAASKNAPPPAGTPSPGTPHAPPGTSPPGSPVVTPAVPAPVAPAPVPAPVAPPAVAPAPVAPPVVAPPAVAPAPVAAPVAAAIAKRPLSPFASVGIAPPVNPFGSVGIAPPGKPVPAAYPPGVKSSPFVTNGVVKKPPSPFASEGIAPPYAKDAPPVAPAAARAEAAVQKANVAKVDALTDSQARYVARSLGFGHMPEHLKEVLKQTHPEDLTKALENVPAVAKEKPAAAATPAAASMKLLPEVSESSAKASKAAENKRLVMEAKAKKASPAGAEAIQLPATETLPAKLEKARAARAEEVKVLVEMARARKAEAKAKPELDSSGARKLSQDNHYFKNNLEQRAWRMAAGMTSDGAGNWSHPDYPGLSRGIVEMEITQNNPPKVSRVKEAYDRLLNDYKPTKSEQPSNFIQEGRFVGTHGVAITYKNGEPQKTRTTLSGQITKIFPDDTAEIKLTTGSIARKPFSEIKDLPNHAANAAPKAEPAAAKPEAKGKQPWEMTRRDYAESEKPNKIPPAFDALDALAKKNNSSPYNPDAITDKATQDAKSSGWISGTKNFKLTPEGRNTLDGWRRDARENALSSGDASDMHIEHVEKALRDGKPVPPEVLADYPDIKPTATAETAGLEATAKAPASVKAEPVAKMVVETDTARRQEIANSIAEGNGILKSGRSIAGRKLTEAELYGVRKSVDNARAKLGGAPASAPPGLEATAKAPAAKAGPMAPAKPFDHGELNLPLSKRGITDNQIDQHLKAQRQEAEQSIREGRAKSAVDKKAAKELNLKYGDQLASKTALKHGVDKKEIVKHLDRLISDNPTEALKLLEREAEKSAGEATAKDPKTVVEQQPDGTFTAKLIVPKDIMPARIGGHQKEFLKKTKAGDYVIDTRGEGYETAHEASKDLLSSLETTPAHLLQGSLLREIYKKSVAPIVSAVKEQIQGNRNKQLAKIVADEGDQPAFWMDDQVHLESGIHGMNDYGEKYMTDHGERAPNVFAKKIAALVNTEGEGKLWGANKAAKDVAAKIHAENKVNEAANAVKQKAAEEAKAVEQAEQARIYNEKISLEGEKTIRSSSSANYNVGIKDGKDGFSVIESRIYTKESMPGVELLAWKDTDGWRIAEKKMGLSPIGGAASSAKKALDKGFEAIRLNGGSERIKRMIKSGDFKILNPETGIEATAQAPSVVIKGNK